MRKDLAKASFSPRACHIQVPSACAMLLHLMRLILELPTLAECVCAVMENLCANVNLYSTLNKIAEKDIAGLSKPATLKQTFQINRSITKKSVLQSSFSVFFSCCSVRLNGLLHCCSAIISTHLSHCGFFVFGNRSLQ